MHVLHAVLVCTTGECNWRLWYCGIVVLKHLLIQTEMKVDNANEKEVMRLLQYLTMVLMSMYGHRDLFEK